MTKNKKNRTKNLQSKSNESEELSDSPTLTDLEPSSLFENQDSAQDKDINTLEFKDDEIKSLKQKIIDNDIEYDKILQRNNQEIKEKNELLEKEIDKNNLLTLENFELKNKINELNDANNLLNIEIKNLNEQILSLNNKVNSNSTVDLLYKLKDSLINKNKEIEKNINDSNISNLNIESKNNLDNSNNTPKKNKRGNSLFFKFR